MARSTLSIFLTALIIGTTLGMDCNFGQSTNMIEKAFSSCPGIFDSPDKSYCCLNRDHKFFCCDEKDFLFQTGLGVIVPVIIGIVIVVSLIVCCISCLCCSCCPWYRRRHRGIVYGLQAPVVHVVHSPAVLPQPATVQHTAQMQSMPGMPQPCPPYSEQGYVRQPAYNPNYAP